MVPNALPLINFASSIGKSIHHSVTVKVTEKRCSCPTITVTACLSADGMEYTVFLMQSKMTVTVRAEDIDHDRWTLSDSGGQ